MILIGEIMNDETPKVEPAVYTICTHGGETRVFHVREIAEMHKRIGDIKEYYAAEDYNELQANWEGAEDMVEHLTCEVVDLKNILRQIADIVDTSQTCSKGNETIAALALDALN